MIPEFEDWEIEPLEDTRGVPELDEDTRETLEDWEIELLEAWDTREVADFTKMSYDDWVSFIKENLSSNYPGSHRGVSWTKDALHDNLAKRSYADIIGLSKIHEDVGHENMINYSQELEESMRGLEDAVGHDPYLIQHYKDSPVAAIEFFRNRLNEGSKILRTSIAIKLSKGDPLDKNLVHSVISMDDDNFLSSKLGIDRQGFVNRCHELSEKKENGFDFSKEVKPKKQPLAGHAINYGTKPKEPPVRESEYRGREIYAENLER